MNPNAGMRYRLATLCVAMAAAGWVQADAPAPASSTYLSVGPAIYSAPSYPGARSTRAVPFPYVDAQYENRFYMNATDLLGIYAVKSDTQELGGAVQYDVVDRRSRNDLRFKNLANVNATPRAKLFASQTLSFITGDFSVATDIAGHGQGTLEQANLWATIPIVKHWIFSLGPGVTCADHQYMSSFFAITPAEAAVSSLRVYRARAGIVDLHWNGIATYEISPRWSVGTSVYAARLRDEAANSPVTQQRSQAIALAWLVYKIT